MTEIEIKEYAVRTYLSLDEKRLKDTFDLLKAALADLQNWQLNEKLNELETTYKFMLRYLTEGVKDPEQHHIYLDLLRSCYKLSDSIFLQLNIKYSQGLYYYHKKKEITPIPLNEVLTALIQSMEDITGKIALTSLLEEGSERRKRLSALEKENETLAAKIFTSIWLNESLTEEETESLDRFINSKVNSYTTKSLIISAISLNMQISFDENKALILLRSCENEEEEVRQRALIGTLLFLRKYNNRIDLYPEIIHRLDYLSENKSFLSNLRDIILQFILSKETEKITKKFTEEIIPEMMKISPELRNKIKLDDLMGETGIEDKNPEWTEILEKTGLTDKLQEFSELQMEGADIMHSSFAHLKTYPFFNELSNWFIPFYANQSMLDDFRSDETETLLKTMQESSVLCNSDKYSFFLSIAQMPEAYRKMMIGQFVAESDSVKELQKEELIGQQKKSAIISKQYIQDLYRFFKIHPSKAYFDDIFEERPDFMQVPVIRKIMADKETRVIIGEYYFHRNYFNEAVSIFDGLIAEGIDKDVIYQKKGYCLQMTNNLEQALEAYLKAELLNGNSSWTIKKIAYCYRMLKKPEEALIYYRKAEHQNPDNLSIQLSIGHCYLELKDYTEALKCYFKVEYLDKNGEKAWRPIAWCSFLTGKYEQAMDYFDKILKQNPNASDFLNSGHTQLAIGHINQAIHFYKMSMMSADNSLEKFNLAFQNDIPELLQSGINKEDIPLVLDRLMYDIELKNV